MGCANFITVCILGMGKISEVCLSKNGMNHSMQKNSLAICYFCHKNKYLYICSLKIKQ